MSEGNAIPNEVESEARGMGWVPKEDWKGPEEKWTSAEEYVEKGKNIIPILRKRVEQLDSDLKMATSHNKKELDEVRRIAEEAAYEKATAEYQAKLEKLKEKELEAFQSGDSEEFLKAQREKEALKAPEKKETKTATEDQQGPPPEFIDWRTKNSWYDDDVDMQIHADAVGMRIAQENPNMSYAEILPKVTERIKKAFPHKFENPRRDEPGAVESGSTKPSGTGGNGKTFNDLPASAKAAYKRLEARFKEKGREYKKEDYVKEYFAQ